MSIENGKEKEEKRKNENARTATEYGNKNSVFRLGKHLKLEIYTQANTHTVIQTHRMKLFKENRSKMKIAA